MTRTDRASRLIMAPADLVYRALVDPAMVVEWLPPRGARGSIDEFDPRPGGAFRMTLTFEDSEPHKRKINVKNRCGEGTVCRTRSEPPDHPEICVRFRDPAFAGTMTMTWTLKPRVEGTVLTVTAEDVPVGIRAEDHEAGMASSLSNLAALIEGARISPE